MPDPKDLLPKVEILDEEGNVYRTWTSEDIPDGQTFEELIARILDYHPEVLGYIEFPANYSKDLMADFEVTLDDQGAPDDPDRIGNFVINTFVNGPVEMADVTPIRMHVQVLQDEEHGYFTRYTVFTSDRCFYRTSYAPNWIDAMAGAGDTGRIYRGPNDPTKNADGEQLEVENLDSLAWLDTGNGDFPVLKYGTQDESGVITWHEFWAPGAMDEEIYDPQHRRINMFEYFNDILTRLTGDYGLFLKHKANELLLIHITLTDRIKWEAAITLEELLAILEKFIEDMRQDITDLFDSELEFSKIGQEYDDTRARYFAHIDPEGDPPHMTEEKAKRWDRKAQPDHQHLIDGRVFLDAANIVSGKIRPERLPESIKERVVPVESIDVLADHMISDEDKAGKYHTGNILAVDDPDGDPLKTHWYKIVDPKKIGTDDWLDAVLPFDPAATEADEASFKWITDHPTTLDGYLLHDEIYTKVEFDDLLKMYERLIGSLSSNLSLLLKHNPLPVPLDTAGHSRTKIGIQIGGTLEGEPHDMILHALGTETMPDLTHYHNICSAYDFSTNHSWGVIWDYVPNEFEVFVPADEPQKTYQWGFKTRAVYQCNRSDLPMLFIAQYTNNGGTNADGTIIPTPHEDVGLFCWDPKSNDPPLIITSAADIIGFFDDDYTYVDSAMIDSTYTAGTPSEQYRSFGILVKSDEGHHLLVFKSHPNPEIDISTGYVSFSTDVYDEATAVVGAPSLSDDAQTIYQQFLVFGTFHDGDAPRIEEVRVEPSGSISDPIRHDFTNTLTMGKLVFHDPVPSNQNLNDFADRKYYVIFDDIEGDSTRLLEVQIPIGSDVPVVNEILMNQSLVDLYPDVTPMATTVINGQGMVALGCNDHESNKCAGYLLAPDGSLTKFYEPGSDLIFNYGNPVITDIRPTRRSCVNSGALPVNTVQAILSVDLKFTLPDEEEVPEMETITMHSYLCTDSGGVWECFALSPHDQPYTCFDYTYWDTGDTTSVCVLVTENAGDTAVCVRKDDFATSSGLLRWVLNPSDYFYMRFILPSTNSFKEIVMDGEYDEDSGEWNSVVRSAQLFQLQAVIHGLKEWRGDDLPMKQEEANIWLEKLGTNGIMLGDPDAPVNYGLIIGRVDGSESDAFIYSRWGVKGTDKDPSRFFGYYIADGYTDPPRQSGIAPEPPEEEEVAAPVMMNTRRFSLMRYNMATTSTVSRPREQEYLEFMGTREGNCIAGVLCAPKIVPILRKDEDLYAGNDLLSELDGTFYDATKLSTDEHYTVLSMHGLAPKSWSELESFATVVNASTWPDFVETEDEDVNNSGNE